MMGPKAIQVGTLVKLIRVLMLGPVCLALSLLVPKFREKAEQGTVQVRPSRRQLVPWFIIGFITMVIARSADLIPASTLPALGTAATLLTVISMAALGLGVDVRSVSRAGGRVTTTVVLSLLVLGSASFCLVRVLGL
jgi:uncharacterized membrane protein YadS